MHRPGELCDPTHHTPRTGGQTPFETIRSLFNPRADRRGIEDQPCGQPGSQTMIIVPGRAGKDLCDPQLGVTRRDILRVGGSGLLGLGLGSLLELQAKSARGAEASRVPGWGKAKSIILVY